MIMRLGTFVTAYIHDKKVSLDWPLVPLKIRTPNRIWVVPSQLKGELGLWRDKVPTRTYSRKLWALTIVWCILKRTHPFLMNSLIEVPLNKNFRTKSFQRILPSDLSKRVYFCFLLISFWYWNLLQEFCWYFQWYNSNQLL